MLARFILGPPGAGKTTLRKQMDITDTVVVDAGSYDVPIAEGRRRAADQIAAAVKAKANLLVEETGGAPGLPALIRRLRRAGYTVSVRWVMPPLEECVQRAMARGGAMTQNGVRRSYLAVNKARKKVERAAYS